jgi:hypothetical protein
VTIGAYASTEHFAYPGWRLTVPGGPAGGHYKGFTHHMSAGTQIEPGDEYEADRSAGASSHDAVHASPANPRGIYRSSGEVPPRPNASGAAHAYRGFQTARHAGTSVAPGSFPAPFTESDEDEFLAGLGFVRAVVGDGFDFTPTTAGLYRMAGGRVSAATPTDPIRIVNEGSISLPYRPNTVAAPPPSPVQPPYPIQVSTYTPPPSTGATSVVNQPPPVINPPSPSVSNVPAGSPISPTPSPVVASPVVVRDGSGNYIRVSDGSMVSPSDVYENPATGQLQASVGSSAGVTSWLTDNSLWSAVPNWTLLAAGVGVLLFTGKGRR